MSHSNLSLSEYGLPRFAAPFLVHPHIPPLFLQSHGDNPMPTNPRAAGLFGCLAKKSPLTGYEHSAIVETSSTEVTPIHHASRRTSFCSAYNSGEDATPAPVFLKVDERQSIGRLASPLLIAEERSKCNFCVNLSLYMSKFHVTLITHSKHGETCCDTLTETEVEQGHKKRTGETTHKKEKQLTNERTRAEQQEVRDFQKFRAEEAVQGEHEALLRLSEAEFHSGVLLEEQRNQTLSEEKFR